MKIRRLAPLGLAAALVAAALFGPAAAASASASTPVVSIVPTHAKAPTGGTTAVGAGIDSSNQNAQLAETVPATVAPSWHREPPVCPQSEGMSASSISVSGAYTVVDEVGFECSFVSAYSTKTGALHWRKSFSLAFSTTVTGGVAYVLHENAERATIVDAITVSTGVTRWSKPQAITYGHGESVGSGLVVNADVALRASTGQEAFRLPLGAHATTAGTTLVAGGAIFYNSDTSVAAYSTTGKRLWETVKPGGNSVRGAGSGNAEPALHAGLLYVRSSEEDPTGKTLVLDPATGKIVRTLPRSDSDWSFDGRVGFATVVGTYGVPTTLSAIDLITGATFWKHSFPMEGQDPYGPPSAPIVENGLLWLTQASDSLSPTEVLALDEVTGAVKTDFSHACATGAGDLVVAQHRLFVSSQCGVLTFVPTTKQPVIVSTPGELLADPSFEKGTSGWTALGAGTVAQASLARSGKYGVTVTPTSATTGTVGFQQATAISSAQRLSSYSASCWVRPSKAGLTAAMSFDEWAPGSPDSTLPNGLDVPSLAVGVWTHLTAQGYVQGSDGDTLALRVYARNASTTGGTLSLDDCSITRQAG